MVSLIRAIKPYQTQRPVSVEHAGLGARRGRPLREVLHREVLVDGVPGNLELPGYLGDRVALHPRLAYRISLGHADHSFLASLVDLRWR